MIAALLMTIAEGPTLSAVERLPAAEAGDLALGERPHRPVATVTRAERGLAAPGVVELLMTERPVAIASGCLRTRWHVSFTRHGNDTAEAVLSGAFDTTQVALSRAGGCPTAGYVHVNPGLAPAEALSALGHLHRLRSGTSTATFTCHDSTSSGLCASPGHIQHQLAALTPWAATREGGDVAFWLGAPGQAVTEVRFARATPTMVTVRRRIPAPS